MRYGSLIMKAILPVILMLVSSILIALDLLLHSGEMEIGLWLRVLTNLLLIAAMVFTIHDRAKAASKDESNGW